MDTVPLICLCFLGLLNSVWLHFTMPKPKYVTKFNDLWASHCHRSLNFVTYRRWDQKLEGKQIRLSYRFILVFSWIWEYWRQWADERFIDPPPSVDPGAFSGQRQGWRPQEDPLAVHCFCVCSGSALLGDLLGVSRSRERDLPSVLSIYPSIFLCVFVVYRRVVRILCLLLYSAIPVVVGLLNWLMLGHAKCLQFFVCSLSCGYCNIFHETAVKMSK